MKARLFWLLGMLPTILLGQSESYYAGSELTALTPDYQRIILFGNFISDTIPQMTNQTAWDAHWTDSYALISLSSSLGTDLNVILPQLLQDTSRVEASAWGYTVGGSFPLWPHKEIVYEPAPGTNLQALTGFLQAWGATLLPVQGSRRCAVQHPADALLLSRTLVEQGWCAWAHPDFIAQATLCDPYYSDQFSLHNTGQVVDGQAGLVDIDIDAPEAWMISQGSSTINVAVLDEGVAAHEDLEDAGGASRVLAGYDVTNPGSGTGAPIAVGEGHGQSCAGLIAASHNTIGTRGVAPNVNILPIYATFSVATPVSQIADGINWAWNNGADVISNSWVYYICTANPFPVLNQALDSATTYGRGGLGCVLTFAAGNISGCVGFPANKSNTLALGAITKLGALASYSNNGPELDLVVPSAGTTSDVRTLDRMGTQGYNTTGAGDLPNVNYTRNFGGTSSATALCSGAAAILLSEFSYLPELAIRDLLRNSATDMGPAGFDNTFGHGRISIGDALQLAFNTYFLSPSLPPELSTPDVPKAAYLFWDENGSLNLHTQTELEGTLNFQFVDIQGRRIGQSSLSQLAGAPIKIPNPFPFLPPTTFLRIQDERGRNLNFRIPPKN